MSVVDWERIGRLVRSDFEISLIVATFEIDYGRGPGDLRVDVFERPDGRFYGVANCDFCIKHILRG
jgi:hypothetical protein